MAIKYVSGKTKELKVGLSSYSEGKPSLQVTGNVGVGTTNPLSLDNPDEDDDDADQVAQAEVGEEELEKLSAFTDFIDSLDLGDIGKDS